MRTRLLVVAALLALTPGCGGGDQVVTSDPGHEAPSGTGSPDPSSEIGPALVAFARGGPLPPTADEVELYLGNALTGVLAGDQARDRRAWATCTELGSYAGAACPLSPLTLLRQHTAVDHVAAPRGDCLATYGPLPPDLRRLDRTVVVPRAGSVEGCAEDFAVQLITDDGELVAVSTLMGQH